MYKVQFEYGKGIQAASSIRLSTVPLKALIWLVIPHPDLPEKAASFRTTVQRMCFARAANFNLARADYDPCKPGLNQVANRAKQDTISSLGTESEFMKANTKCKHRPRHVERVSDKHS